MVASAVKNLASQTARATEEIAAQVAAIQAETKRAVEPIRGIDAIVAESERAAAAELARNGEALRAGTPSFLALVRAAA